MDQLTLEGLSDESRRTDSLETSVYARCPLEHHYKYVLRQIHTASGTDTALGRALHAALHDWFSGPNRSAAELVKCWQDRVATQRAQISPADAQPIERSLLWFADSDIGHSEPLALEASVQTRVDEFAVRGRIDAVLRVEDRILLVDFKLTSEMQVDVAQWDQLLLLASGYAATYRGLPQPTGLAYIYFRERVREELALCPGALPALVAEWADRARAMADDNDPQPRPGTHCADCGAKWRCPLGRPDTAYNNR